MLVRVYDKKRKQYYKSMVYAKVDTDWLSRCVYKFSVSFRYFGKSFCSRFSI